MEATWGKIDWFAVGGLREIGFYKNTNYLMVMSNNRGIFDCYEGKRVAREYSDYYYDKWNSDTGIVEGFDFLEGEEILCGGFEHPNILRQKTSDGWGFTISKEQRENYKKEVSDCEVMYLTDEFSSEKIELEVFFYGIDRAYGFSNNDNCLVVSTSSDILMYKRIKALNTQYT